MSRASLQRPDQNPGTHHISVTGTAGFSFGSWNQIASLLCWSICFTVISLSFLPPSLMVEAAAKINYGSPHSQKIPASWTSLLIYLLLSPGIILFYLFVQNPPIGDPGTLGSGDCVRDTSWALNAKQAPYVYYFDHAVVIIYGFLLCAQDVYIYHL